MRTLLTLLFLVGVMLLVVGAVVPQLFVLSLLGLVVLTGTASVTLAAMGPPGQPRLHH
ncbi:hypothetical protein [Blastococcus saxobsidens]|uniref:Uncharacterized protein n=1 Tax=Blastococcus saxobsidens TaxID=138336 RepID=A0A4Q7Y9A7_9ACTN|nr:hypothetical protein [Blastococcus saxobsidens]RZU32625.1 hypothetical protein BKA19_2320 [Blastococcus saxobsidens]